MLEATALACERGSLSLFAGVEFALSGGGLARVRGPNGSGKTSLLRILAGLTRPAQRENSVVRAATQTLISHIDGLMQQVARALSHAGTYGRQGRVEGVGPVPCGIDMVH